MARVRPGFFSARAIHDAYLDCRRRKRGTPGAAAFELRLADELVALQQELCDRTYRPRPAVRFAAKRPKLREIVAADFRDRVVHHLFVRCIEADWERVFIHDSFASRPRKGTHAAVVRLGRFLRSVTRQGRRPAWFLQMDIKSFFVSVDRSILFDRLDRRLRLRLGIEVAQRSLDGTSRNALQMTLPLPSRTGKDAGRRWEEYDALRWLASVLVFHDPVYDCAIGGDRRVLARVPQHKTLLGARPGCGLPIGNLTSQFFGNVYLDALDQFVKHELRAHYYIRYVDDIVILDPDRSVLQAQAVRLESFLARELRLQINSKRTRLRSVQSGIDFLGYVSHPSHRLVRRRVIGNLHLRLVAFAKRMVSRRSLSRPGTFDTTTIRCRDADIRGLRSVLSSYLAHFAWADCHRLVRSVFAKHPWLEALFDNQDGRLRFRFDRSRRGGRLSQQYRHFCKCAGGAVLFLEVGRYFELLDDQAVRFGGLLGMRAVAPRPGFRHRGGFPRRYLQEYVERALHNQLEVLVVKERRDGCLSPRERTASAFHVPYLLTMPTKEVGACHDRQR